jgi:uncharacterized protein (TIGR03067 family)
MKPKFFTLPIVCFALSVFAVAAPDDSQQIQGSWVPVTAEMGGQKMPEQTLRAFKLTLSGDKYTAKNGEITDSGTFKLNPSAKPKTMDITGTDGPNQGTTFLAIYELAGDTLKICYDLSGDERPKEFKSNAGTQEFLVTYRREKR